MRVIQKGDVKRVDKLRDKKYKVKCPCCESVLEVKSEEIECRVIPGSTEEVYLVSCPLCGYYFRVNMKPYLIPEVVEIEEVIE